MKQGGDWWEVGQVPRQVPGDGACVIAGTWSEQTHSVSRVPC